MKSVQNSVVPVLMIAGLAVPKDSLFGLFFFSVYNCVGPMGYAFLVAGFIVNVWLTSNKTHWKNRVWLVPAGLVSLGLLPWFGGSLGLGIFYSFQILSGSAVIGWALNAMVFVGFMLKDHWVHENEETARILEIEARLRKKEKSIAAYQAKQAKLNPVVAELPVEPVVQPEKKYLGPLARLRAEQERQERSAKRREAWAKPVEPVVVPKPIVVPDITVLQDTKPVQIKETYDCSALLSCLKTFGIPTRVNEVLHGPSVTTIKLTPESVAIKYSKVIGLEKEIMGALQAVSVRIVAPIPGTNLIGIEIPRESRITVGLKEILQTIKPNENPTTVVIGRSNDGRAITTSLAKMPHLIVAGTTGSGKSVCLQSMIATLLMRNTPETLKLCLIDPKQSEFQAYEGIPHLWSPVVYSDTVKAIDLLEKLVAEMENRYKILAKAAVKTIDEYNKVNPQKLPYIVLFVEEFADLLMTTQGDRKSKTQFETLICRIAQKARACGIHAIIATQRPSVDVVSGLIRSNFPSAIACKVRGVVDSKVILDEKGAEALIGNGDLLFKDVVSSSSIRVQGAFVSNQEIKNITDHYKRG